ncbi:MAG: hypothetical protein ACJ796_14620 [Gemmatimonadaceae bacterium]
MRRALAAAVLLALMLSCDKSSVTGPARGIAPLDNASVGGGHGARISLADYCNGTDNVDDTTCIDAWLDAGRAAPDRQLYAPAGTYLYKASRAPYSKMHLECGGAGTIFRNNGGTGIFFSSSSAVHDVAIDNCSFDVSGSTENFLAVISINPAAIETSEDIRITRNRFFDSAIAGSMSAEQRQYILIINCNDCLVEGNRLSEGGRIKIGQPGTHLIVRKNYVDRANDNAITVVDAGAGVSRDIVVDSNVITSPKGIGIFFGVDGDAQNDPTLASRKITISHNRVTGDWLTSCILGTLPNVAREIVVSGNRCEKTGTSGQFATGITIRRTSAPQAPADDVKVEDNLIFASGSAASGSTPALDEGGIFVSGSYVRLDVNRNRVLNVGSRAIHLYAIDAERSSVVHNVMVGGGLVIEGVVHGHVGPNQTSVP